MRRHWILAFAIAALTLALYWPVRHHDFVGFDDTVFVTENPVIQSGLNAESIRWAFTHLVVANWHPVTTLSHMLDCQLFGVNPGAHHLLSASLHAVNAALLFLLAWQLTSGRVQPGRDAVPGVPNNGAAWPAAFLALLWAVHPLRVESVAWISERKDLLSGLFFLLTLMVWVKTIRHRSTVPPSSEASCPPKPPVRRSLGEGGWRRRMAKEQPFDRLTVSPSDRFTVSPSPEPSHRLTVSRFHTVLPFHWYGLSLALFALGLMSKPMLVTLPFVLLLLDLWPLGRFIPTKPWLAQRGLIIEKTPFFALAALFSVLTFLFQRAGTAIVSTVMAPMADRVTNALVSYVRYLSKTLWPSHLAAIYPNPALVGGWTDLEVGGAVVLLLVITAGCIWFIRAKPWLAMGWFWFLGTLVPVIGVVQVGEQAMADRYTYIPGMGLVFAVTWLLADLAAQLRWRPAATAVLGSGVLLALAVVTTVQIGYWHDTISLFRHTLAVTGPNPSAEFALGTGLEAAGQTDAALEQYKRTVALAPGYRNAHFNMGQIYRKTGQWTPALEAYDRVLQNNPRDFACLVNSASVLTQLRRFPGAVTRYDAALELDPNSTEALNNLAWLLATCSDAAVRNGARAVTLAERACELSGNQEILMVGTLAAAYAEAGRFSEAVATALRACQLAETAGNEELLKRNRELLELYKQNQPYHETP